MTDPSAYQLFEAHRPGQGRGLFGAGRALLAVDQAGGASPSLVSAGPPQLVGLALVAAALVGLLVVLAGVRRRRPDAHSAAVGQSEDETTGQSP